MNNNFRHKCSGQAISEFVILLTIMMILCAGMIYVNRLLTFQFWAAQEARITAFRSTWPATIGMLSIEPQELTANRPQLRPPKYVSQSIPWRGVQRTGNLDSIWASLEPTVNNSGDNGFPKENSDTPILIAKSKDSIWTRKTSDWLNNTFSFVNIAYAFRGDEIIREDSWEFEENKQSELEKGYVNLLTKASFGKRFCLAMSKAIDQSGLPSKQTTTKRFGPASSRIARRPFKSCAEILSLAFTSIAT